MNHRHQDRIAADLAWVAERLEDERPVATPLELDRIKLQAQSQASRPIRSRTRENRLKSRLAITAILALGLLMSTTGATLALSGGSEQGSAGTAQYPKSDSGAVLGDVDTGGNAQAGATQGDAGEATNPTDQAVATQSDSDLPFTGFAAIPILIGGLGLMGGGVALYRGSRQD